MDGSTVEANGIVTYYDEQGTGRPLVLLHGGMAPNLAWMGQIDELAACYRVLAPERRGHGHTPDADGPYTYDLMVEDTAAFLRALDLPPAHLVGWSDGGIIALLMAIRHPDLVSKVVAFGANASSDGYQARAIDSLLEQPEDGNELRMFRALYDPVSPDGPEHFDVVWAKVKELWAAPFDFTDQLAGVAAPTLVMVADDDLVTLDHALAMYRALPHGELAVLPGLSHAAPMERPGLFNRVVLDFLSDEPVTLLMPYRRRQAGSAPEAPATHG